MKDKTKIFADAQLAKCDAFEKGKTLQQLDYWQIECNVEDLTKEFDELARSIWIVESECLEFDELCKVSKKLNSFRFKKIICEPELDTPCTGTFDCSEITITVIEPEECTIPITAIK